MKPRSLLAFACAAFAFSAPAQQQLVCPPGPVVSGKACEGYHYHLQLYRPDTRKFAGATGVNSFASEAACESARDTQMRRNLAVVDFFKRVKGESNYEPDRVGPCHCDMTREKTNPAYLTDAQREMQIRNAEDVRLRVREKLLDSKQTSDSELVRSLNTPPPSLPAIGGSRLVAIPTTTTVAAVGNSAEDLRSTTSVDTRPPAAAALDLPLVDVTGSAAAPQTDPAAAPSALASAAGEQAPPMTTERIESPGPDIERDIVADEGAAESFITYETERIQNVLRAASGISDGTVKSQIFEASLQRTQLLSNLRTLIEGSGARSRLASAARSARTEEEHLEFAAKLFGRDIEPHWAPKEAADVILPPDPDIESEPERALRDTTGRFNDEQKRRALYVMLARSQPTNEQQLWLVTVIDSFLR